MEITSIVYSAKELKYQLSLGNLSYIPIEDIINYLFERAILYDQREETILDLQVQVNDLKEQINDGKKQINDGKITSLQNYINRTCR